MDELIHNGRWVTLTSDQQPDGTWACDYTVLEIGPTRLSSIKLRHQQVFSTREAAEAAAFEAAQVEIDARGSLT